jgi:small subunit ribosomal protein S13
MTSKKTLIQYLISFYGINLYKATKLCIYIGSSPYTFYKDLTNKKKETLTKVLTFYRKASDNTAIENNLKNYINTQLKRKITNNSYSGKRYRLRLPVRGQRTSTNARNASLFNSIKY